MATSIRLDKETEARLDALAAKTGRTKAYYLRELIEQGLPALEDYYLAFDLVRRVKDGSEPVHSAESVRRDLE